MPLGEKREELEFLLWDIVRRLGRVSEDRDGRRLLAERGEKSRLSLFLELCWERYRCESSRR